MSCAGSKILVYKVDDRPLRIMGFLILTQTTRSSVHMLKTLFLNLGKLNFEGDIIPN